MTNDEKREQLFCAIVTGMLANTNGGNLVWAIPDSQQQIINAAQGMALIAYPAEVPVEAIAELPVQDAVVEEVPADPVGDQSQLLTE